MGSILVVCHGNVCRSVYAQHLLRVGLTDVRPDLEIVSAGVDADVALLSCDLVASRVAAAGLPRLEHVPTRLTSRHVVAADLVLCATVAQRSAVVHRQPGAQRKAFTLLEAGRLADWDLERGADPGVDGAVGLADRLRAARGRVPAPVVPQVRHRWWRRPAPAPDPWDIVDGHHLGPELHRQTLDLVEGAVAQVARALGAPTPTVPQEGR